MIVPDVNLLVYAYNRDAPHHLKAKTWWEDLLNSDEPIGLPWVTGLGFIRLMTHRAVLVTPLESRRAVEHVRSWFAQANVEVLDPGARHLEILERLFKALGTAGNLTTDAQLAALAIEHQCELCSNDADFARFPGLRWRNPLEES
ncbi:MAG: type II toxin-antitoxin system VapC family toxin [Gammaproteobacteria bacterium]|nr:type II toxin-antitoxin system VapC family toxin [Gammaproteobacteria bacterium]